LRSAAVRAKQIFWKYGLAALGAKAGLRVHNALLWRICDVLSENASLAFPVRLDFFKRFQAGAPERAGVREYSQRFQMPTKTGSFAEVGGRVFCGFCGSPRARSSPKFAAKKRMTH